MEELRRPDLPRSQVSVKTALTVALTASAVVGIVWILVRASFAITLSAAAAVIAVALHHGIDAMTRRGVGRRTALSLVLAAVLGLAGALGMLVIPPAVTQVRALIVAAPELVERARQTRAYQVLDERLDLDQRFEALRANAPQLAQRSLDAALNALTRLLVGIGAALTLFFLVAFMLAFGPGLVRRALDEATPERRALYARVLAKVYRSVGGYIGGLSLVCAVNAVVTTGFLAVIGVPYFLPLGVVSGLSSLIPIVGNTFAGILITLVAWVAVGLWPAIGTAVYYVLYQQFENHVLGPVVYRRTVDVNPLVMVLVFLVFSEILGLFGAIIAVPAVAVGQIIVRELLTLRRDRLNLPRTGPASAPPQPPPRPLEPAEHRV